MPDDETTTRTEVDESTQPLEREGIGEVPAQALDEADSTTEGEESPETNWQQRYEEGTRKIQQQGQEMAQMRQQFEQTQEQLQRYRAAVTALGQEQIAQDLSPVERARYDLKAAYDSYDPVAINEASLRLQEARLVEHGQAQLQQFAQMQRMQQEIPEAAAALGIKNPQELAPIMQRHGRGPMESAVLELMQRGGPAAVARWAGQFEKQERDRAATANLLRTSPGQGRGALGQAGDAAGEKWVFFEEWAQLNKQKKDEYRNSPDTLKIYGAPDGFDPMKD